MKKLFYQLSTIAILLSILTSCSKEEIDSWNTKGYVWFENENNDFSFRLRPEITYGESCLIPIPLTMATNITDYDRIVNVTITRFPTDKRTTFEVQEPVIFHAGYTSDTLWVKVTNSEHLASVHDTISFQLASSNDLELGLKEKLNTNLCLYNGFNKPKWWDNQCEYVLGYFTQLKMEIYNKVTGDVEDPRKGGGWYQNIAITYIVRRLNDYVSNNNIRYPDDDPNAPGEAPKFDFWRY